MMDQAPLTKGLENVRGARRRTHRVRPTTPEVVEQVHRILVKLWNYGELCECNEAQRRRSWSGSISTINLG